MNILSFTAAVKLDWLAEEQQRAVRDMIPELADIIRDLFDGTCSSLLKITFDGYKWVYVTFEAPGHLSSVEDYVVGVVTGFLRARGIPTI